MSVLRRPVCKPTNHTFSRMLVGERRCQWRALGSFLAAAVVERLPRSLIEARVTLVRSRGLPILLVVPMKADGSRWAEFTACLLYPDSDRQSRPGRHFAFGSQPDSRPSSYRYSNPMRGRNYDSNCIRELNCWSGRFWGMLRPRCCSVLTRKAERE